MPSPRRRALPVSLLSAALLALALVPGASQARKEGRGAVHSFTGTVSSLSRDHKVFRIRRSGRPSVRVRVTRSTRVARGTRLKRGLALGVKARKGRHGWVASRIARSAPSSADDPAAGDDDDPGAEDDDPGADDDPGLDDDPGFEDDGDPSDDDGGDGE